MTASPRYMRRRSPHSPGHCSAFFLSGGMYVSLSMQLLQENSAFRIQYEWEDGWMDGRTILSFLLPLPSLISEERISSCRGSHGVL